MAEQPILLMKTSLPDLIYLKRLCKRLQSLLKLFGKRKSNSQYLTKQEKLAIINFQVKPEKGLSDFVRRVHNQTRFIPELRTNDRQSVIYFLEMLLSLTQRQYDLIFKGDINQLKSIQKELKDNDIYSMKRESNIPWKDEKFETMITDFLKGAKFDRDNDYANISDLPVKYLQMLEYYFKHRKGISETQLWYDFLAITAYMFYGTKLELLTLKKLQNR